MKKYEKTSLEIVEFSTEDVICVSNVEQLNYGKGDDRIGTSVGEKDFGDMIAW